MKQPTPLTILWLAAIILLAIALFSCSPLRHYNKVAADKFRNEAELNILAPLCRLEFPFKEGEPVTIKEIINDSAYTKWLEDNWYALKDSVDNIAPTYISDTAVVANIKTKFITLPAPPPVIRTVERNVPVEDKSVTRKYEQQIEQARKENTTLAQTATNTEKKFKEARKDKWLFLLIGFAIGVIGTWIAKLKKII
jgi:hypothetical protein